MQYNKNPISLREGHAFIDGVEVMDDVKMNINFTPEVWTGRQLGEKTPSTRWIGATITGSMTRRATVLDAIEPMATASMCGDDLQTSDDAYEIYTDAKSFTAVRDALERAGYQLAVSELTMVPQNTTPVPADKKEQFEKLVDALEDDDDVSNVYTAAADEEE